MLGSSLGLNFSQDSAITTERRSVFVVRSAKKYQLCQTKRNRSRKSLARTHGFRKRMRTTTGRAVIKRRRAKGRWNLCPKSNPNSGKRAWTFWLCRVLPWILWSLKKEQNYLLVSSYLLIFDYHSLCVL